MNKVIEEIEDLEQLDAAAGAIAKWVHKATQDGDVKSALSGTWLGHQLHPMLTDIPIGAWAMASALDLTAGKAGAKAARRLVALGLLATVPTAATGASDWSDTYGGEQRVGLVHAGLNVAGAGLQAMSWRARGRGHRYRGAALSLLGLAVTAGAGYLGGHLTLVQGVGVNNTAFQPEVTDWTAVAKFDELGDGEPRRASAGDVAVVLVRQGATVHALSATCVHASGPLDQGTVVEGCLRCPWHGSEFRLTDGKVVRGPAAVDEPAWEVKVDDGEVHVRSSQPHTDG